MIEQQLALERSAHVLAGKADRQAAAVAAARNVEHALAVRRLHEFRARHRVGDIETFREAAVVRAVAHLMNRSADRVADRQLARHHHVAQRQEKRERRRTAARHQRRGS